MSLCWPPGPMVGCVPVRALVCGRLSRGFVLPVAEERQPIEVGASARAKARVSRTRETRGEEPRFDVVRQRVTSRHVPVHLRETRGG